MSLATTPVSAAVPAPRISRLAAFGDFVRGNFILSLGILILLVLILAGIFAPAIAPFDPYAVKPPQRLRPPSGLHFFGTGLFGDDIFSRALYALRLDLGIGAGAVLTALIPGTLLGAIAGYFRGAVDEVIMRLMDIAAAFPGFILAMAIAGAMGPSIPNLIIAIGFVNIPVYARLVRERFLLIGHSPYADAARSVGASHWRIIVWHLLPNSIGPIATQSTLQFGWAILDAAGLSFIGLGVPLPTPELGSMLGLGVPRIITGQWWISFFPGLLIAIAVMGFSLTGDGLQDYLESRRRR